jgi:hypothetical protein
MLKDASKTGTPAPAFLNGHIPAVEEEGWIDKQKRKGQEGSSTRSFTNEDRGTSPVPSIRRSIDSGVSSSSERTTITTITSPSTFRTRADSISVVQGLNPSTVKPVTGKDNLTVSVRGVSSLSSPIDPNPELPSHNFVPNPKPNTSRLTVSSLLNQLSEIHDHQQTELIDAWDKFFQKRSVSMTKGKIKKEGGGRVGVEGMVKGSEEWKGFARLGRGGIPLVYRSEVWMGECRCFVLIGRELMWLHVECSGAKELMVPGEYKEILGRQRKGKGGDEVVLGEIEKDVGRTFPGNVYFGGCSLRSR